MLLAATIIYPSSTPRPLAAQGSSAGSDQLYVVDIGHLYRVAEDGTRTLIGQLTWSGCPSRDEVLMGLATAPDGTLYGAIVCGGVDEIPGHYNTYWGRLNPDTAEFTSLELLTGMVFATGSQAIRRMHLAFPAQFGAAGSPIGYRIKEMRGVSGKIELYAIDALSPYREHLLDGNIAPAAWNFVAGNAVTLDGTALFPITRDLFYRLGLSPVLEETVSIAMHSDVLEVTSDVTITGFDSQGRIAVFDAITWWWLTPATTQVITPDVGGTIVTGANYITFAFVRRAPLGGVRIEPHEQLTTSESGTSATFTAVLTAQPTDSVTVHFTSSDTTEGTVSPASATFTTGNWDTPQTITVTGVLDNDTTNETFSIVTASTSADANYHARGILDVDVTNTNVNQAAALAAGSPSARQGSAATTATLGTASDLETAAGSLTVETITVPSGVTVGTITNTAGSITAPLSSTCSATTGARTLTLRVTDGASATTDQDVTVTVLANTAPTLGTYNASSVLPSGATLVTANASPADNGSVASVDVSSPSFTGTLSVNESNGTVSISNAGPVGVHTVTITATDNCGATFARTFDLTVNTPPTLAAGTPSARQGSPATGATLGTAGDAETAAESLTVATVTVPSGLTVGTIANTTGSITAPLTASCIATIGARTLTLRVTDALGGITDQDVTVTVLANTAPTLGTYNATMIAPNGSTEVTASASPADQGSVSAVDVSSATFTGTLSVNASNGTVSVSNAAPAGIHTVTITVTDNCGTTFSRTFDLTVNASPALAPGTPSARQGSPATGSTLGTVSDAETAAGALTVATVTVPSGLTVGTITNTSGTITAPLTAECSATPGARLLTLRVTDGSGATTDQNVTVNILVNTAPSLGSYPASSVAFNGNTTIVPSAAPADNGSASISAAATAFTGEFSGDATTGEMTVTGAAPPGGHTVTVMASDNCSATTTATFTLTVACPATVLGGSGTTFTVGGGSGSVAVTAVADCAWSGSSGVSWIGFVTGNGAGSGTATFTVAGNGSGAARSTELTIGGQPFTVTQSFAFADAAISAGETPVRAVHLQELRFRIDRLRAQQSLAGYAWTDGTVTGGATPIRGVHVTELRTALLQAYTAAARAHPAFTDAAITTATAVRAIHLNELRAAVIALESSQ